MTPRWAQRLETQANPAPTAYSQIRLFRLVMAGSVLCVPFGLYGGQGTTWLIARYLSGARGPMAIIAIIGLLAFGLAGLTLVGRTLGTKGVGPIILPALTFFCAFTGAVLFRTFG